MIAFEPKGSSLDISHASNRKSQAIQNLSSGSWDDVRHREDPGSLSVNLRINGHATIECRLAQNMQNLVSYPQIQDGVLKQMDSLASRMVELASLVTRCAIGYTGNNSFWADYKGSNGSDFIKNNILPQLSNTDTGSVGGSDANPSAVPVSSQDVVPDTFGKPVGSYTEDTGRQSLTISYTGDGDQNTLNPVSPISFSDTSTYNLSTVSASSTLEHLRTLIDTIASNRAIIGANMSVTKNSIQSLKRRTLSLEKSISRTHDAVNAEKAENISKGDLLLGLRPFNESTGKANLSFQHLIITFMRPSTTLFKLVHK